MLVKIGQQADHGFDQPLGLLSDCHRRIERFLGALVTVARTRAGGALTASDRHVLEAALHYFASAAPRHSADEESSLFPRLRASGDRRALAAVETIDRLEHEHRVADSHHRAVDGAVRRWLAAGSLAGEDAAALAAHLDALSALYRAHISIEDEDVFPAAGAALTAGDLEAIGREMAARRNVSFTPPAGLAD
jgi:hemerythrin-like domain-containing protein